MRYMHNKIIGKYWECGHLYTAAWQLLCGLGIGGQASKRVTL